MPTLWIRTADELARFVEGLGSCRAIAVDTEADSLHHYVEKVCLLQIATDRGHGVLIDPLALAAPGRPLALAAPGRPLALAAAMGGLAAAFADPRLVKVFHAGQNDIAALGRDFGWSFAGVVDTLVAARFLGHAEIGLSALVEAELGIRLAKGNQKDDWSRRPLSPAQEAYALADVEHLLPLAEGLLRKLMALGRVEWAREEFRAVAATPAARRGRDPHAWQRLLKGRGDLDEVSQAVLREVHGAREAIAADLDLPPFKIVANDVLVTLALERPSESAAALTHLGRFPYARRAVDHFVAAIARGMSATRPEPATDAPRRFERRSPERRRHEEALRRFRAHTAETLAIDPALVLPQRLIDRLTTAAPRRVEDLAQVEGLGRWRIEAFGPDLVTPA